MKIVSSEAILTQVDDRILKERIKKSYRLPEIDKNLRKRRTHSEAKLLREAARAGTNVPRVINESEYSLELEFIHGEMVSSILNENENDIEISHVVQIATQIAESIAIMHNYDIIHGDLTTANMIFSDGKVYMIDFGLGFFSKRIEDKSMDLHMIHNVIKAIHPEFLEVIWDTILKVYQDKNSEGKMVIKSLRDIEERGRYVKRTKLSRSKSKVIEV